MADVELIGGGGLEKNKFISGGSSIGWALYDLKAGGGYLEGLALILEGVARNGESPEAAGFGIDNESLGDAVFGGTVNDSGLLAGGGATVAEIEPTRLRDGEAVDRFRVGPALRAGFLDFDDVLCRVALGDARRVEDCGDRDLGVRGDGDERKEKEMEVRSVHG